VPNDPDCEHCCGGLGRAQRETQDVHGAETVVTPPFHLVRVRRVVEQRFPQDIRVGKRNAEHRLEHTRLVLALAVQRVKDILLNFRPEVGSLAAGQFHWSVSPSHFPNALRWLPVTGPPYQLLLAHKERVHAVVGQLSLLLGNGSVDHPERLFNPAAEVITAGPMGGASRFTSEF